MSLVLSVSLPPSSKDLVSASVSVSTYLLFHIFYIPAIPHSSMWTEVRFWSWFQYLCSRSPTAIRDLTMTRLEMWVTEVVNLSKHWLCDYLWSFHLYNKPTGRYLYQFIFTFEEKMLEGLGPGHKDSNQFLTPEFSPSHQPLCLWGLVFPTCSLLWILTTTTSAVLPLWKLLIIYTVTFDFPKYAME